MKAVVLTAGEGGRFWPLTETRPKSMLPVGGKPTLRWVVEAARDVGIDELVFVVGYRRERVQRYFGDGDRFDVSIDYVVQDPQRGNADALSRAAAEVDERFLVLRGDQVVLPNRLEAFLDRLSEVPEGHVLSAAPSTRLDRHRPVTVSGERVQGIAADGTDHLPESLVDIGLYAFEPTVFEAIERYRPSARGEVDIADVLADLVASGTPLYAHQDTGVWHEITYPWDLLSVTSWLRERATRENDADLPAVDGAATVGPNATVRGTTTLSADVTLGAGAVVEDSVVLSGATVDSGAVVRDAVLGSGVTVGPNATVVGGYGPVTVADRVHSDVRLGAAVADGVTIEGGATLRTGTLLGPETRVGAGAVCGGRIDAGTTIN